LPPLGADGVEKVVPFCTSRISSFVTRFGLAPLRVRPVKLNVENFAGGPIWPLTDVASSIH